MSRLYAITGATGFAGRHAVSELLGRGHRLRALVRRPENAPLPEGVELIRGDLADAEALARLVTGADAVVHLAGVLAALGREEYFRVNRDGTEALLDAATAAEVPRFVHISSLAAREPSLSPYGASKRAGEEAVLRRAAEIAAVVIRPPAVYGPGDKGTLPLIRELTRPIAAIPGPREARFSLIHGRDLARLIAETLTGAEQGIHEVSDNKPGGYGWPDLIRAAESLRGAPLRAVFLPRAIPAAVALGAEAVARITGKPSLVNRGKIAELYHRDWVSRQGTLALADPISLEQGLAETAAWYREAGWLPRPRGADRRAPNARTP
ncbi:NAD-dependent epimerase/dehydratase family protein [Aestuariivirga sp.]|uniref:NAD-dependent epimerase/dehydratase family protein n=1 Tax=Aestuariivirga sp. TaxID=2650926 RepID=UPI003919790A